MRINETIVVLYYNSNVDTTTINIYIHKKKMESDVKLIQKKYSLMLYPTVPSPVLILSSI